MKGKIILLLTATFVQFPCVECILSGTQGMKVYVYPLCGGNPDPSILFKSNKKQDIKMVRPQNERTLLIKVYKERWGS